MKQLILIDHPERKNDYSEVDYFISDSNAEVYNSVIGNQSHQPPIIIKGDSKSGKTHIGRIWVSKHNARILSNLEKETTFSMYHNCLVDDIDELKTQAEIEALLHIYNNAVENKKMLLMTTRSLEFSNVLPDLRSRLRATTTFTIPSPDDELLRVIVRKQFYLRQIRVPERIVDLILHRVERSIESVIEFISLLDREALRKGKPISTRLLQEITTLRDGCDSTINRTNTLT
ncbi:bacterial dnaA family protein [Neorickettsia helminthoeca str. Oregon]|uniref:Bacterial dnaA family protein n=1 Tax=Neorickettsia helminthoeca str. Oregon TaxID=1286528 RepID=X5HJ94_9RICK|nr:DnaA/Hda family protein [Neorickettsia helminthoeca]AHX11139.1 bacterial dnaA family protein [Neorickettsia helminthoeca str. Oregon]